MPSLKDRINPRMRLISRFFCMLNPRFKVRNVRPNADIHADTPGKRAE
jgi:hypothetical protein